MKKILFLLVLPFVIYYKVLSQFYFKMYEVAFPVKSSVEGEKDKGAISLFINLLFPATATLKLLFDILLKTIVALASLLTIVIFICYLIIFPLVAILFIPYELYITYKFYRTNKKSMQDLIEEARNL